MASYYDRDGNPMSMLEWAAKFEDMEYKRVAFDKVGEFEVSTVWLGLDHSLSGTPPLIFESIVFGSPPDEDNDMERYSTEADAIAGHQRLVAALTKEDGRDA